ncbi:MAG: signal peptide peptidase SppA, partial [Planctomycetota bacterium]
LKFGSTGTYLLASACSEVSMVPSGILEIPGVGMGRMYLKDLFDLVGVEFQELRMGRYKSAVEGYTRSGPSDPVREETHALLDELYSELIDSIAENRDMKAVDVRSLIDTAMFLPEEAKERGLIDHIEYGDQFQERVAQKRKIVAAPMGKKLNLQVGGFAVMMTLFNELFAGPKRTFATKKPKLAIVSASGQIMESSQPSLMGGAIISSSSMVKTLRGLYEDDTVKAVVLRVNSPGGSALASDLIWRELELLRTKKPVVVSMGDLAASGGYYISCNAHWIVAERGTLTGSIGVIGAVPNFRKIGERVGVKFETFSRGKRNGMISPYGEISKDGRDSMMRFLHKIYDDFVSKVAKGRKLDKKAVHSIAEGRVWTGGQALEIGLVDELGGVDVAIAKAKSLASLDDKVEVLRLPKAKTLFEVLNDLEGASLSTTVTKGAIRSLGASLPKEIREALAGFEWLGQIDRKQAFLLSPHLWTIR